MDRGADFRGCRLLMHEPSSRKLQGKDFTSVDCDQPGAGGGVVCGVGEHYGATAGSGRVPMGPGTVV